jgi:FKBP-type peptidyl-prolyl cis-trans isomerase FklB
MKYLVLMAGMMFSIFSTAQTNPGPAAKPVLKTALDSFSYAMGMSLGNYCNSQGVKAINSNILAKGATDAVANGQKLLTVEQMNQIISSYVDKTQKEKSKTVRADGQKFLSANAVKPGVKTLPSGLQYQVITTGSDSVRPAATNTVRVHYHGTLIDGTVFDSSIKRGQPAEFPVNGVIKGWTEALQLMTKGSKWRLFIPAELAYGDRQAGPDILPGSTLIFDVELLEIVK